MASKPCAKCGKAVYAMEQVSAVGKTWHKSCLKCGKCGRVLRDGNWEDHAGSVYCTPCHEKHFVDAETQQIIHDMETHHARVVHGGAKAMPGMATNRPPPPALGPKSTVHASSVAPPPAGGPRRGLSAALQGDIVRSARGRGRGF
ncbi:Cysteine and glycine-rich protein 1 [Balamuthia mandrillaris]